MAEQEVEQLHQLPDFEEEEEEEDQQPQHASEQPAVEEVVSPAKRDPEEETEEPAVEEVEKPAVEEVVSPAKRDPEEETEEPAVEEVEKPAVEEVVSPAKPDPEEEPEEEETKEPALEEETEEKEPEEEESEEESEEEETEEPAVEEVEELAVEEVEELAVEEVEKLAVEDVVNPVKQDPKEEPVEEETEEEPEEVETEEPAVEEVEEPAKPDPEEEETEEPAMEKVVEEVVKATMEQEVVKAAIEETVNPALEEEAVEEAVKPVLEEEAVEEAVKPALEEEAEEEAVEEAVKPAVEEVEKPAVEEVEKPAVEEVEKPAVETLVEQKVGTLVELQLPVEEPAELAVEQQQQPAVREGLAAVAAAEQEPTQEEAAPGSLSFPFLEEESTETTLRGSRTLYILLGLPGAGKSRLAAAIRDRYQDSCAVVRADDHGVKPERYGTSADGHKGLDEAVASCCGSGRAAVVVDDTNHTNERLARLGELAEEHRYFALFVEPRTPWRRDVDQLPGKTHRGLDKSQIQALRVSLEAACYPLYFGWFLRHSFRDELDGLSMDLLKTLGSLEAFRKHQSDFTTEGKEGVNLEEYFHHDGPLHCTTKFCDYGNADGAKEYAESQVVQQCLGSVTELQIQALFVTPRTLGARVALTPEQLQLWPGEGVAGSAPPPGSRAHVTLGCARGVEPAQTGLDLLQILQLPQQEGQLVEDLELGQLSYYGNGIWVLGLREPRVGPALFSCFHGRRKPEDLRKKKIKCTLL